MRRIDIRDLPNQSDEEMGTGETYRIERGGRTIGFFHPVKRADPEASMRAFEEFDRMLERMRAGGWSESDIEDVFDLSKPYPMRR